MNNIRLPTKNSPRSKILILLAFCPSIGKASRKLANLSRSSSRRPFSASIRAFLGSTFDDGTIVSKAAPGLANGINLKGYALDGACLLLSPAVGDSRTSVSGELALRKYGSVIPGTRSLLCRVWFLPPLLCGMACLKCFGLEEAPLGGFNRASSPPEEEGNETDARWGELSMGDCSDDEGIKEKGDSKEKMLEGVAGWYTGCRARCSAG